MSGLTQYSGGTDVDRVSEARLILFDMGVLDKAVDMHAHEQKFIRETAERLRMYGDRTTITPKQLFWLRDLKDLYL